MKNGFGIDLGTTNSVISWLEAGKPTPIPIDGSPIVPSVVLLDGDRFIVGRDARNLELSRPESAIRSVKRRMGQDHRYSIGERTLSPEEVSAALLGKLKEGAERATGHPVKDVVVTVPAYFDDAQRKATLRAGELAGIRVTRLLNEPTSASLIYDRGESDELENLLVYDLGGGTFDVSVVEVFGGVREVRATAGNSELGGDDFDELILRRFLDEVERHHGIDLRGEPLAMARLRRLAEDIKIRLSLDTEVEVTEEFLSGGAERPLHLSTTVTRRQLEELVEPLLERTIELAKQVVDRAGLEPAELSRICLIGGSTRVPLVRRKLAEAFPGVDMHGEIDADLAVGLGASVQSGLLEGVEVSRILVDVTAHSLGILTADGDFDREPDQFSVIVPQNTALPSQRAEEFYTRVDGQEGIEVKVYQGEAPRCSANTLIGSFHVDLEPAPAGAPVRVEFAYDLNGVVRVSVAQSGADVEKTVALSVSEASHGQEQPFDSAVLRKARALLETLEGDPRSELERLLEAYREATGPGRERAEDALLDFFVDLEDH
jgi:molecular chaperone DnaK